MQQISFHELPYSAKQWREKTLANLVNPEFATFYLAKCIQLKMGKVDY